MKLKDWVETLPTHKIVNQELLSTFAISSNEARVYLQVFYPYLFLIQNILFLHVLFKILKVVIQMDFVFFFFFFKETAGYKPFVHEIRIICKHALNSYTKVSSKQFHSATEAFNPVVIHLSKESHFSIRAWVRSPRFPKYTYVWV